MHDQAEAAARSITDPIGQAKVLAKAAAGLAAAGLDDRAGKRQKQPRQRRAAGNESTAAEVVRLLAGAGLYDRAEAVAQ